MDWNTEHSRLSRAARSWLLPVVLILVVAGLLLAQTAGVGLLGWDTYPIIISSRVLSVGDLVGNFTERLMDERYAGRFYRPLLNLSFALDYALWGLAPFGYQLTSMLIFAACAGALYLLALRAAGSAGYAAAMAALLYFLLHASHFEVLPIPSRRPEALCCLFMCLALASQLAPGALNRRRPPWLPALFTLLALASKETALMLPLLTVAALLLYSPRRGFKGKATHAALALLPHGAVVGLYLLARVAVLDGLGGHAQTGLMEGLGRFPLMFAVISVRVLIPQQEMAWTPMGRSLLLALTVALLVVGLMRWGWRRSNPSAKTAAAAGPWRLAALAFVWMLLTAFMYGVTGQLTPWYTLMMVAGYALLLGAWTQGLLQSRRLDAVPVRVAASLTLCLLLAYFLWQASFSPLVHHYDQWQRATAAKDNFLSRIETALEKHPEGTVVQAPPMPKWILPTEPKAQIYGTAILNDYSLQAWAELTHPERRIHVVDINSTSRDPLDPQALTLVITHRLEGY